MRKIREARHPEANQSKIGIKVDVVGVDINAKNRFARAEYRVKLYEFASQMIQVGQSPLRITDKLIAASTDGTVSIVRNGKTKRMRIDDKIL